MSGPTLSLATIQVGQTYRVESQVNHGGERRQCNFNGKFKHTTGGAKFMVFEKTMSSGKTRNITVFVDKLRIYPYSPDFRAPKDAVNLDSTEYDYDAVFPTQESFTGSADQLELGRVDEIPPPTDARKTVPVFDMLNHAYAYVEQGELVLGFNPRYHATDDPAELYRGARTPDSRSRSSSAATMSDSGASTDSRFSDDSRLGEFFEKDGAVSGRNYFRHEIRSTGDKSRFASKPAFSGENPMNRASLGGTRRRSRGRAQRRSRRGRKTKCVRKTKCCRGSRRGRKARG